MSLQRLKAVAVEMVRSLPEGRFTDIEWNSRFWAWTLTSGNLTKEQFLHRVSLFGSVFANRAGIEIDTVTAEEDRVFVQFRVLGELITGKSYRQNAAFMVEFDDRGRVRHWREYFDSRLVAELLFPAMQQLESRRSDT